MTSCNSPRASLVSLGKYRRVGSASRRRNAEHWWVVSTKTLHGSCSLDTSAREITGIFSIETRMTGEHELDNPGAPGNKQPEASKGPFTRQRIAKRGSTRATWSRNVCNIYHTPLHPSTLKTRKGPLANRPIILVPFDLNRFQKSILLIVKYKYLKSCSLQNLILRTRSCSTGFITQSCWVFDIFRPPSWLW